MLVVTEQVEPTVASAVPAQPTAKGKSTWSIVAGSLPVPVRPLLWSVIRNGVFASSSPM